MDIKFDSEPVYDGNVKYIKTKIKIDRDKVNTSFQSKKLTENSSCKFLSLIMLDSAIKASKKYCPQTLLEECKYEANQKRLKWRILLMMNQNPVHVTINLIMRLNLIMNPTMNNWLKFNTLQFQIIEGS